MIRPFEAADRAFVVDSWLSSFRRSAWSGLLLRDYKKHYGELVSTLLDHPDVRVMVSTDDATELILGWAAYDASRKVFHYTYVKEGFRDGPGDSSNVAIDLIRALGLASGQFFWFTFRTQAWEGFYRRHHLNCKHKHHLVSLYENQSG